MIRGIAMVGCVIAAFLGGLWMLQGLGLVHLSPILCFADCAPVQGPSQTWAVIGAAVLFAGGVGLFWGRKRPNKLPQPSDSKRE